MIGTRRLRIARDLAAEFRRREGSNLIAVGLYGSVAQGHEREHSDVDLLLVLRRTRRIPRATLRDGVLVTLLQMTAAEAREEVAGSPPHLAEALSGWRSMKALYDPARLLRRLRARARRPTQAQWREAARCGLLGSYEDYGKLLNAVEAGDALEAREMAIWLTTNAMLILFALEGHVPASGHRLFADVRRRGRLGEAICNLRYGNHSLAKTRRLAEEIWTGLLARAAAQGIRIRGLAASRSVTGVPRRSRGTL